MIQEIARRVAILTRIVEKAPGAQVGRTALMKFLYFITALRGLNLGYRFTLYSYGPFDSAVLEDADYAATLNAVRVRTEIYRSGYGYVIEPGAAASRTIGLEADFVAAHDVDIDWVLDQFGTLGSAELELASTVVFVDQENSVRRVGATEGDLIRRVRQIKPHFSVERVTARVKDLRGRGLLQAVI